MKNTMMKAATSICTLALALTPFFHFKGASLLFFGEPKYPQ